MAISFPAGFQIGNFEPIDSRTVVSESAQRLAFIQSNVYEGLTVYQTNNNTTYVLTDTGSWNQESGWSVLGGGLPDRIVTGSVTASVNVTTGSIFQLKSGSRTILNVTNLGNTTLIGSGSANPIFFVSGSQGELFTVSDSLSGSLFAVNDVNGLSVFEAFSDNTVLMGSSNAPALYTTVTTAINTGAGQVIYSIPTASCFAAYYDYAIKSESVGRVGNIMAMWSGSSVNFTETSASSFGTTTGFIFGVIVTGSNMALTGSTTSGDGWIVRTIIRAI